MADNERNPISGLQPNQFSKVAGRELPAPKNVKPFEGSKAESARLGKLHKEATAPGGKVDPALGYGKPEGMSYRSHAWLTGAHHMFPNESAERGEPAINEPHEHNPGITVSRRAEDLSGKELAKGKAVLSHFTGGRNPIETAKETHRRTMTRVIGEHAQAGVEESTSQHFYGGKVTTDIPDPQMRKVHEQAMGETSARISEGAHRLANHPQFVEKTPGMSEDERLKHAHGLLTQSIADTSPNTKWRESSGAWPNIAQAEESATAGIEGREPRFIAGRAQNHTKAADRVGHALNNQQFDTHHYGNPSTSPKTMDFRGALTDRAHTDARKVSDIHEASVLAPGLPTGKSQMYAHHDEAGNVVGTKHAQYPDMPKSAVPKGMSPVQVETSKGSGKYKVQPGLSRPEQMLSAAGHGIVHAINDHASRHVLSEMGLSRSPNHSDNVHAMQAAAWGSQQMLRPDVNVSHADQYPVVRNWGAEGHSSLNEHGRQVFPNAPTHMGPQFARNTNTSYTANTPKAKPYPLMP